MEVGKKFKDFKIIFFQVFKVKFAIGIKLDLQEKRRDNFYRKRLTKKHLRCRKHSLVKRLSNARDVSQYRDLKQVLAGPC